MVHMIQCHHRVKKKRFTYYILSPKKKNDRETREDKILTVGSL